MLLLWLLPTLPLSYYTSFQTPQPQLCLPHLPHALRLIAALVFFLSEWLLFWKDHISQLEVSNATYMYDLDPGKSAVFFFSCLNQCWWGLWACYVKCSLKTIGFQCVRGACWKCRASAPPQMDWVTIRVSQDCSWLSCTFQRTDVWCSAYRLNHRRLIVTQHYQSLLSLPLYHHWCNFTKLCWISFLLIMWPLTNNPWFRRNLKSVCVFPLVVSWNIFCRLLLLLLLLLLSRFSCVRNCATP